MLTRYNEGPGAHKPGGWGRGMAERSAGATEAGEDGGRKPLKSTLNLPQTAFAMKANLPQSEPARLAKWSEQDLYGEIRKARAGSPKYILHDGPPYANGAIHLGHALNKCIKDFVVKTKTMAGFDAPYVPGWDCHGLPIEIKVDEQLGRKKLEMPAVSVRRACREYAQKYVEQQRTQFERIGVFGRWDEPYLTMSPEYEARIVETFYDFFEQGYVYKGLKPVFWCIHDQTALAEAEVEYEQHTSPSVYVRYRLTSDPGAIAPELAGREVYTIIWTTTPWTIPASQAVAFNPEMEYVAVAGGASEAVYVVASALRDEVEKRCGVAVGERAGGAVQRGEDGWSDVPASFSGPICTWGECGVCDGGPGDGCGAYGSGARGGRLLYGQEVRAGGDSVCRQCGAAEEHWFAWGRWGGADLREADGF